MIVPPVRHKPMLGDVVVINMTTPDFEVSSAFYKRLGFSELMRSDFPFPVMFLSDGAVMILMRKMDHPFIGLTYFVYDLDPVLAELAQRGVETEELAAPSKVMRRIRIVAPDNHNISLVTHLPGIEQPQGNTMLSTPPADCTKPELYTNQAIGMFGEFSHCVKDLELALEFWQKLGFFIMSKNTSPYPWAIIADGMMTVGLHQDKEFVPRPTFFSSDAREKIAKLKAEGLDNYVNAMGEVNITIATPEKQHVNVFYLGM